SYDALANGVVGFAFELTGTGAFSTESLETGLPPRSYFTFGTTLLNPDDSLYSQVEKSHFEPARPPYKHRFLTDHGTFNHHNLERFGFTPTGVQPINDETTITSFGFCVQDI